MTRTSATVSASCAVSPALMRALTQNAASFSGETRLDFDISPASSGSSFCWLNLFPQDVVFAKLRCRFRTKIGDQGHQRHSASIEHDRLSNHERCIVTAKECSQPRDVDR